MKIKVLIEALNGLDVEGSIYCFDFEDNQAYALEGLPIHDGAEIYCLPIKKTKKGE